MRWLVQGKSVNRVGILLGLGMMLTDMVFYGWLWMKGRGYFFEPWRVEEILEGRSAYHVWNALHLPINEIFGPILFPYFQPHGGGLPDILSWSTYLVLCFLQVFLTGFIIGLFVWKLATKPAR